MKSEIPAKMPGKRLADLFGMPERTLTTILRTARIGSTHGYDVFEAARAAISWALAKAEKNDSEAIKDRGRRTKAEADLAEMERGRAMGTLCDRDSYRSNYADAVAQGVRNIMRLEGLRVGLRDKVLAAIRDVKLPEPEEK